MNDFRKDFIVKFKNLLESKNSIHCVWEGGSAATGYLDQYSDLDLGIICDDKKVEENFQLIEDYLQKNYGIKEKFRTPEPSWHGHSQCYYLIDNTPELFYVDILIEKQPETVSWNLIDMENLLSGSIIKGFSILPQPQKKKCCKRVKDFTNLSLIPPGFWS